MIGDLGGLAQGHVVQANKSGYEHAPNRDQLTGENNVPDQIESHVLVTPMIVQVIILKEKFLSGQVCERQDKK